MNYVTIFWKEPLPTAENTFNEFFADVARKGHRVMHTKYEVDLNMCQITAIFTINSEPHPHKKL